MADLDFLERSSPIQVVGSDEQYAADVSALKELASFDVIRQEGVNGSLSVTTTPIEAKVGASRHVNRKLVFIRNNSNNTIYWGFNSSVSSTNGIPLEKSEFISFKINDAPIFLVVSSGTANVRIAEA